MKIALDVDGVLADVIFLWLDYNNKHRQIIKKHEVTEWDFWKKFHINRFDFYKELSNCWKNWKKIPPTESRLSLMTKHLAEIGTIDIVTAREKHTSVFVKNWLQLHEITYHDYVTVTNGPDKANLDYDVFIDDSPLNANKIINAGKKIMLYSQPWNHQIINSDISRINSLDDAITILRKFK